MKWTLLMSVATMVLVSAAQLPYFSIRKAFSSKNHDSANASIPTNATEMRVLLCVEPTPFTYISGYANRYKEMLNHLNNSGVKFHIITADKTVNPPKSYLSFPIHTMKGIRLVFYQGVVLSVDVKRRINTIIKKFKPDLMHVSTPSLIIYPAMFWSWWHEIPLIASYHTNLVEYSQLYFKIPFVKWLARNVVRVAHMGADLVLATSPQLKESLELLGVKNVDIWQKGINTERFSPSFKSQEMRNRLSSGTNSEVLLLYVGRLGAEKKLDKLKIILDNNPNLRLVLVGSGPAEESLKKLFENNNVNFMGSLEGDELSQAFASCDIFVMPSDTETLGFVVLEAMASGLPVVGVAAGGLLDIIHHNITGYLANNDDNMVEFEQYVRLLVDNPAIRSEIAAQARMWSLEWSWGKASEKLRTVQYKQAIENFNTKKSNRKPFLSFLRRKK